MDISGFTDEQLIRVFVELRTRRDAAVKAFTDSQKPVLSAMEQVNNELLNRLNNTGLDSFSCDSAVAYKSVKRSASVKDREAFLSYVISNDAWHLADLKANAPAVEAFAETHQQFPPGVQLNRMQVVNVRRK